MKMPIYVDADSVYTALEEQYKYSSGAVHVAYRYALDCICAAKTGDVAPVVHAHWTNKKGKRHDGETYCSACGGEAGAEYGIYAYLKTEYCPNCGARMDEWEET